MSKDDLFTVLFTQACTDIVSKETLLLLMLN
jgi:hypothetical protein